VNVGVCRVCGAVFDRRRYDASGRINGANRSPTCPKHRWRRGTDEPLVDRDTPYEDDVGCQLFVSTFRGGATLDAIAEAFGVSRERVRQIETEAVRKLGAGGLASFGLDPSDPEEQRGERRRHDAGGGPSDVEEDEEAPRADDPDAELEDGL
jgi:hypothetical protein